MNIVSRKVINVTEIVQDIQHPTWLKSLLGIVDKHYVIRYTACGWIWQTVEGYLRELEAKQ
jgi:hypothetical protein